MGTSLKMVSCRLSNKVIPEETISLKIELDGKWVPLYISPQILKETKESVGCDDEAKDKEEEIYSIFLRDNIEDATLKLEKMGIEVLDINGNYKSFYDVLQEIDVHFKIKEPSTSELRKKIKYSKNPMEKKMLEKQLNGLYKERKKR